MLQISMGLSMLPMPVPADNFDQRKRDILYHTPVLKTFTETINLHTQIKQMLETDICCIAKQEMVDYEKVYLVLNLRCAKHNMPLVNKSQMEVRVFESPGPQNFENN